MWKTIPEVADYYDISERTVWRKIKAGEWQTKNGANVNGGRTPLLVKIISDTDDTDDLTDINTDKNINTDNTDKSANADNTDNTDKSANTDNTDNPDKNVNTDIVEITEMSVEEINKEVTELCQNTSATTEIQTTEPDHPDWNRARLEDRIRAWAKYYIVRAFMVLKWRTRR